MKHCPVLSGRLHQKEEAYRQLRLQQSLEHDELDDDVIDKLDRNNNASSASVPSQINTTLGGHLVKKEFLNNFFYTHSRHNSSYLFFFMYPKQTNKQIFCLPQLGRVSGRIKS